MVADMDMLWSTIRGSWFLYASASVKKIKVAQQQTTQKPKHFKCLGYLCCEFVLFKVTFMDSFQECVGELIGVDCVVSQYKQRRKKKKDLAPSTDKQNIHCVGGVLTPLEMLS